MEEILGRGVDIDGVVAANDEMATGAIEVLREHGRRVPREIPVTGFDDILLARLADPTLTTVAQPFALVIDLAIRMLVDQLAGREVPDCTSVGSRFIRRQSCGCGNLNHRQNQDDASTVHTTGVSGLDEHIEALRSDLADVLRSSSSDGFAPASHLIDGLRREFSGQPESLEGAVVDLLDGVRDDGERHQILQSALGFLRAELRGYLTPSMEDAFYESLNMVALANTTMQLRHRLQLDENYLRLLTLGEQASLALDLTSLQDILVRGLPNAGVRTACLSCVSEEDASTLVPSMCLLDGKLLELDGGAPPGSLVPPQVFELDRRFTFLVFPLAFDSQLLGVIAFSYSDGPNAYLAFRNEIAAALKSIRLRKELVRETRLRERSVQERLATTKRMEALSVLAGGVAHDLNNALGPLVVVPDVILDEIDELPIEEGAVRELRADVQSIKAASLRAAQTIKDLLTLGRQGRMLKEALDLNRLVQSCLSDGSVRSALEGASRVKMSVDMTPLPLAIRGSESQLARAIGNLVRNAVEAVAADGKVVVKTSKVHVTTPTPGYENIPPGHYAVVTVSDDGCGIAPRDLSRVFEPFFTNKRTGENSGSGLGLAIVHGVVKEHEGFIDVQSTLDMGTSIALYLPTLVEQAKQQEQARIAPRGSARILMVDDEPIQLQTLRRVLVRLGYQVDVLDSGARAFEVFNAAAASRQSPYDLLIMDMMLGEELDGLQILEQIQHLFPTQRVIMTSGYAPSERTQLAAKKVLPWLAKPYTIEELGQAVQLALWTEPDTT